MERILPLVAVFVFVLGVGNVAFCYPVMNQTGNLISNGNFESGQIAPWIDDEVWWKAVLNI